MPGKDWGILERSRPSSLFIEWRTSLAPFYILDMLIAAGLGDVPQELITWKQFERAMNAAIFDPKLDR